VSKQDSQFFNVFSVVLGLLVTFVIVVFAFARYVGKHNQNVAVLSEPMQQQGVESRTAPPARVAVAGQDNSALTIAAVSTAGGAVVAVTFKDGTEVYEGACKVPWCGPAGAPVRRCRLAPRTLGGTLLYDHAIMGFNGQAGVMPPKGGASTFRRPDQAGRRSHGCTVSGSHPIQSLGEAQSASPPP
jgi:cytochrome c5